MKKTIKIIWYVLVLLFFMGLAAWVYQLMNGLGVTGMSNGTSWGLYIAMFMFFVGLSAGGLIVASSASVFRISEYKKVALPAIILSTSCIIVAGLFVVVDLGGLQRAWLLVVSPHVTSPLIWDVIVITIYLIVNIAYLLTMVSRQPHAAHRAEIISRAALPIAILVHTITAWIFGLQYARDWYSSIMGPLFVVSALDSGLALLLVVLMGLKKAGCYPTTMQLISKLAGLMVICIAIDAYMVGCELITTAYPLNDTAQFALKEMFMGTTAPFFWCEVIFGLLIPFCLLVFSKNRRNMKLVALCSLLVIIGVFCKRVWLLFTAFIHPNINSAQGIISGSFAARGSTGDQVWATTSNYFAQVPEILIVIGVISFGALMFIWLAKTLIPRYRQSHQDVVATIEEEITCENKGDQKMSGAMGYEHVTKGQESCV